MNVMPKNTASSALRIKAHVLTDLLNFMYGVNGFFGGMATTGNLAVPSVCKSPSGTDREILLMSVVEPLWGRDG